MEISAKTIIRFKCGNKESDLTFRESVEMFMYVIDVLYTIDSPENSNARKLLTLKGLEPVKNYLQNLYNSDNVSFNGESPELGYVYWNDLCPSAQEIVKNAMQGELSYVIVSQDVIRDEKLIKSTDKWLKRGYSKISIDPELSVTDEEILLLM